MTTRHIRHLRNITVAAALVFLLLLIAQIMGALFSSTIGSSADLTLAVALMGFYTIAAAIWLIIAVLFDRHYSRCVARKELSDGNNPS